MRPMNFVPSLLGLIQTDSTKTSALPRWHVDSAISRGRGESARMMDTITPNRSEWKEYREGEWQYLEFARSLGECSYMGELCHGLERSEVLSGR